jgi:DNA-directed RNA polymerase subunit RPC12/RpoP
MGEEEKTYLCPVCGGKLEYFVEFADVLCTECGHQSEYDDDDNDYDE